MAVKKPLLLLKMSNLLIGPYWENHVLVEKESLQLLAWTVNGKSYLQEDYQKNLSLLSQMPEKRVQAPITNRLDVSGIGGVAGEIDPIRSPLKNVLIS